jgi:3-oxoacyl-[acyl-carrier-protein] synthase II
MKRVVITGMGSVSPLGVGVDALMIGLAEGRNAVQRMDEWNIYQGLQSLVGAPAPLENEKEIPRKQRRSMGRMSIFAAQAAKQAELDSGLDSAVVQGERCGCITGSTMGSAGSINETFEIMLPARDLSLLNSTKFFQCVSHTTAMNVSQYLGIRGMVLSTAAACASGLQAVGTAADLIRSGRQDVIFCGGAEELHPTVTGSFDILYATSTHHNDTPEETPRPFDKNRDGLVCGEGAGILVLEELEHAKRRGAKIYGEVSGYYTCASGTHISQSDSESMIRCMRAALDEAKLNSDQIDYISAHATATLHGDEREAEAIQTVFGSQVPVSSLKGNLGHTLGASGAIELIASLKMMEQGILYPTHNLKEIDPACEGIEHVLETRESPVSAFLKNSFAFGGINAALICNKA